MERVIFDHIFTDDEINQLPKESAEYQHWQRYKWIKLKGKKILDCSCGTGYGSGLLAQNNEVTGVDISEEAIEFAKQHFTAEFKVGNAEQLEFEDESFDAVVSFETIEHLDNPYKFLS